MDTTAIDAAGLKPLQPTLDSIAAIRDRKDLARVLGSTLRADVDALNNTNFYTEHLFGLWVAQDLDDPDPLLAVPAPGRARHARPELLRRLVGRRWRRSATSTRSTSPPCWAWPRSPSADAKAAGDRAARDRRSRSAHWSREESGDVSKGNNHWAEGRLRRQGAGPRLGDLLRRRRARRSRRGSSCGSRAPSPASRP